MTTGKIIWVQYLAAIETKIYAKTTELVVKPSKIDNFGTQKEMSGFYIKRDMLETMNNGSESERTGVPYSGRVCRGILPECLLQNLTSIAWISFKKPK